jgi:hypothetical protein
MAAARKHSPKDKPKTEHSPGPASEATYITSRGVLVHLAPFPALATSAQRASVTTEWQEAGRALPEKPTYQIQAAGGAVETHEHDESTIKGDPEAEAAWAAWQESERQFQNEVNERKLRTFIVDCMDFEINPSWEAKAKAKRLKVPADEWERKVFFAETEVLGNPQDYMEGMNRAAQLAGVSERDLKTVRDSFRRAVEVTRGEAS